MKQRGTSFQAPDEEMRRLTQNFPESLKEVLQKIGNKKGLVIALDDVNGLSRDPRFANWYKSFVDQVATHEQLRPFPVFVMLIGLRENWDALSGLQPSLMRIFRIIDVEKLTDQEVSLFFETAFARVGMTLNPEALSTMTRFSSGLPVLMHEIGDAAFWITEDNIISEDDAVRGIFDAADRIGKKYLSPTVYRAIRSQRYKSILRKLSAEGPCFQFVKQNAEANLSEDEKKVFANFLRKMRGLGIIEPKPEGMRGEYRFVNDIYPIYIWMESREMRRG
ncbi:MAG: hypothetical protein V2A77_06200 [Pseudomonadota bacterium]